MYAITANGFRGVNGAEDLVEGEELVSEVPEGVWAAIARQEKINQRDLALRSSDWTLGPDSTLTDEQKQPWLEYRQELRDLPEHPDFPDCPLPKAPAA